MDVDVELIRVEKLGEHLSHCARERSVRTWIFRMIRCGDQRTPADLLDRLGIVIGIQMLDIARRRTESVVGDTDR